MRGEFDEAQEVLVVAEAIGAVKESANHHAGQGAAGILGIGVVVIEERGKNSPHAEESGVVDGADGFAGDVEVGVGNKADDFGIL